MVGMGVPVLLIDRETVAEENLGTQEFTGDVGLSKAEARARALAPSNPSCRVEHMRADIRHIGMGVLRAASLLASCVDSIEARVAINLLAVRMGIPWVDAAIDGSGRALFGRVAAYNPRIPPAACFLCPHSAASIARAVTGGVSAGCSAAWRGGGVVAPPTMAVAALGGTAASIQAMWALKFLLDRGDEVAGKEVYFDLDRGVMTSHELAPNSRCVLDHRAYSLMPLGRRSLELTVGQTFDFADELLAGSGTLTLSLPSRSLVARLHCSGCGAVRVVARVPERVSAQDAVCACGVAMRPDAMDVMDSFHRGQARDFLPRTWSGIGLPAEDVVVASRGLDEVALLLGGEGN
jgi:adenylyltransferase/sulfurtransferase